MKSTEFGLLNLYGQARCIAERPAAGGETSVHLMRHKDTCAIWSVELIGFDPVARAEPPQALGPCETHSIGRVCAMCEIIVLAPFGQLPAAQSATQIRERQALCAAAIQMRDRPNALGGETSQPLRTSLSMVNPGTNSVPYGFKFAG